MGSSPFIPSGQVVSAANSFLDLPISAGEEVIGDWESILSFPSLTCSLNVADAAAVGTFYFEFSYATADVAVTPDVMIPTSVTGGFIIPIPLRSVGASFRTRYVNGPTPTVLRQLILCHYTEAGQLTRVLGQSGITDTEPVLNVRAVIAGKNPSGTYQNVPITDDNYLSVQVADANIESISNMSTTPLAANASFTGSFELTRATAILVNCLADQNSATDGLAIQWSSDGVTVLFSQTLTVQSGAVRSLLFSVRGLYFRLRYTNGPVAQGSFFIRALLQTTASAITTQKLGQFLTEDNIGQNVRALAAAKDATSGAFGNLMGVLAGGIYALYTDITDRAGRLLGVVSVSGNVAVTAAALPLPTGASTEATLAEIKAKTDNLDVALSTRAVTGLTDAQLRATAVPTTTGDTVATGVLAALNASVQVAVAGRTSVGFQLAVGGLNGTIVAEVSFDGGLTWVATRLQDSTGTLSASAAIAGAAVARSIVLLGGASHARVRVSAFTSGSSVLDMRATTVPSGLFPAGGATEAAQLLGNTSLVSIDTKAVALVVSATGAANTGVTATLPAVVGQRHYITRIEINRVATAAVLGSAVLSITTTNLPGPTWSVGNAIAAGATAKDVDASFNPPLRSSVVNTATTIVCPVPGLATLWRVNIYYYTAP